MGQTGVGSVAVIGLGYVGLPLTRAFSAAGVEVVGLDISSPRVDALADGRSTVDDVSDADVAAMLGRGFLPTTDDAALEDVEAIVICVPTPLAAGGAPDMGYVLSAVDTVRRRLQPGQLIVLESTTYPGTTQEVMVPALESTGLACGTDFFCAFSPERIDPGNTSFELSNTPKVVGADDPASASRATALYSQIAETVVVAKGTREAELAKLLENTYRQVNIALVNEMAVFCHAMDIDLWDSIRCAATKPFGFQAFRPGPGVGGHCIPIDPGYLAHRVKDVLGQDFRFVQLAQEINAGMPAYVVRRTQDLLNESSRAVRGSHVVLLGVTYKPDVSDQRESPSLDVARLLLDLGADVSYCDPYVDHWVVAGRAVPRHETLAEALEAADAAIMLQAHGAFAPETVAACAAPLLDTSGRFHGSSVRSL